MVCTFEEATEEIKKKFEEIDAWFKETYPDFFLEQPWEYSIDTQAFRWATMISKDGYNYKACYRMYSQKMHHDGWYLPRVLEEMVPSTKKLITETLEAPWEKLT